MNPWKADVTRFLQVSPADAPADLTERVDRVVYESEVVRGLCYVFTPHRDTTVVLVDAEGREVSRSESFASNRRNQLTLPVVDRHLFLAPGQRVTLRDAAAAGKVAGQVAEAVGPASTGPSGTSELPEGGGPGAQRRRVLVRVVNEPGLPEGPEGGEQLGEAEEPSAAPGQEELDVP